MKKTLGSARLTYEELLTVLVKIEGVLNSRPLTYACEGGGEPLTPSQLVTGRRLLSPPCELSTDQVQKNQSAGDLVKRERHLNTVLSHFWSSWRTDYLTQLREHHKSAQSNGPVSVGDVVCIHEEKKSRLNWSIGKVERLLEGADGNVRAAVVKLVGKGGKTTKLRRPIQKLFPVELSEKKQVAVPITFVKHALHENR